MVSIGVAEWEPNSLSNPSKPKVSTKPFADLPKLSRQAALAATIAKFCITKLVTFDEII
jgi:hypothetical protein